jgi:hypothetical protein
MLKCIAAAGISCTANAATLTVYDSAGFETPRFVASQNLRGQDAPPVGQGPWLKDSGVSTAVVQTAIVSSGLQAVRVSRVANANGDTRWAVLKDVAPSAEQSLVAIDFDLRVEQTSGLSFGPLFGIECYDSSGAIPKLIGSLTVDATTGDVLYQDSGSGVLDETGTVVPFGTFHHFALVANFTAKTYSLFLEGVLIQSEPFVDSTAQRFTDAPIATFAATPDTVLTASGSAYIDNYVITAIPEPSVISLALVGVIGRWRRRPRTKGANAVVQC